jgi:hypothetical protein
VLAVLGVEVRVVELEITVVTSPQPREEMEQLPLVGEVEAAAGTAGLAAMVDLVSLLSATSHSRGYEMMTGYFARFLQLMICIGVGT